MTLKQAFIDSLAELGVNPEPLDLGQFPRSTPTRSIERVIERKARARASRKGKAEAAHRQFGNDDAE